MEFRENFCTIYLVRHGEAEHNVSDVIQGRTDSPLTEQGIRQAKERAEKLMHIKFAAVFSSDLTRAIKTAEILKLDRQLVVNTRKLLRERDYGPFDGKPVTEYREKNKELLKQRDKLSHEGRLSFKVYPGFESEEELGSRILTALREIALVYPGQTVLVVSHGGAIRATLIRLGFATFDELNSVKNGIVNLAVIKIESDGVDFFVKETVGVNKEKNLI